MSVDHVCQNVRKNVKTQSGLATAIFLVPVTMIFVESALPELQQHHDQDHVQQSLLQLTCHLLVEGAEDLQPWVLDQEGKEVLQGTALLCLQDHNFQKANVNQRNHSSQSNQK